MKIRYAPRVYRQLDAIYTYIAEDNPAAAQRVLAAIRASISRFETHPMTGRPWEGERRRILSLPKYRYLIYVDVDLETETVEILNIWHMSRLPPTFP